MAGDWRHREAKRAEQARLNEIRERERSAEEDRKAELTMWARIEEAATLDDVKDILHRLANGEREQ